jgi:hypothetical protein
VPQVAGQQSVLDQYRLELNSLKAQMCKDISVRPACVVDVVVQPRFTPSACAILMQMLTRQLEEENERNRELQRQLMRKNSSPLESDVSLIKVLTATQLAQLHKLIVAASPIVRVRSQRRVGVASGMWRLKCVREDGRRKW